MPGSVIGILGGGQLGRMLTLAAQAMGYRVSIYTPDLNVPALEVANSAVIGEWGDKRTLSQFIKMVDVVTFEFENVPLATVEHIESFNNLLPSSKILAIAQSRWAEKDYFTTHCFPCVDYIKISKSTDFSTLAGCDFEAGQLLKTERLGYDGKGQRLVKSHYELKSDWEGLGKVDCILEDLVDFQSECSVIAARNLDGEIKLFPVVQNTHKNNILYQTQWPCQNVSESLQQVMLDITTQMAVDLDLIGLLTVEFFITKDGKVLINEIAPRPHNSGHGSINAAYTSQFEQHIRAICNLPLGDPSYHTPFTMTNLLGGEAESWMDHYSDNSYIHIYGKNESREGRKMGHVTTLHLDNI
jgi:5-(carboxyamino)imidazole ribonucleotide synthase